MTSELQASRTLLLPEELEKLLREAGAQSPAPLAKRLGAAIAAQAEYDRGLALGSARDAYREGFLLGRVTPRFIPFSIQMWRASKIFQRLKSREQPTTEKPSRYASFNDL